MTEGTPGSQLTALNQVLSEIVDVALAASQARHAVPDAHPLHAELGRLFASARSWAEQLVELDSALGVSALEFMASPTGRLPSTPQHLPGSDEEVRRRLGPQLDKLAADVQGLLAGREEDRLREVLDRLAAELQVYRDALSAPGSTD